MSRLWRDDLRVALCPQRLIVARRAGLRRALVERSIESFAPEKGGVAWTPAVAAFREICSSAKAKNCQVTAILSSHFVRYAVLPWKPRLSRAAEWQAYAEHAFTKTYGATTASWQIGVCPTGGREPWLAFAADRSLIQSLTETARSSGAKLVSVQPALVAAVNRVRRRITQRSAWLVLQEAGWITLALLSRGAWQAVRSRPVDGGWGAGLAGVLDRESVIAGFDRPIEQLYLISEEGLAADGPSLAPYRVADLTVPAGAPRDLRACALALV